MSNLFQKLELEAFRKGINPRTRESREWFRNRVQRLTRVNREQLMRQDEVTKRATHSYGGMFMYFYDPKHKDKLPYYDTFPLVLPLEKYPDGFLGINFHYLPMKLRLKLLDRVVDFSNNTKFDESTRLAVDYSKLKNIKLIKPTLHRYLAGHTKSDFRRIDADEFTIAALLPVQRFKKSSADAVWSDSRSMV